MTDSGKLMSTGRGGAGNIRRSTSQEDQHNSSGREPAPQIKQKVFTTGRGGAGNMRDNVDPKDTRAYQDVEAAELAPIASPTVGRGGYGNVRAGQRATESLFSKAKKLFK